MLMNVLFLRLIGSFPVVPFSFFPVQILHHHIASVEKLSLTTTGCPLFIQCRNFRVVHFVLQRERDCHDVYSSLLRLLRPGVFHPVVPKSKSLTIRWKEKLLIAASYMLGVSAGVQILETVCWLISPIFKTCLIIYSIQWNSVLFVWLWRRLQQDCL